MTDDTRRHRGELYAALAAMGFGSAYVATAFALTAFEPIPAAAWRSFLAALGVGAIILAASLAISKIPDVNQAQAQPQAQAPETRYIPSRGR